MSQYPLRRAPSSDLDGINILMRFHLVSIPSQAGTLFGPSLSSLTRSHEEVSIPSQAGTLFGPRTTRLPASEGKSLNTLSGGHPLRTRRHHEAMGMAWVSIPSQAGTLFGRTRPPSCRLSSTVSQYPLRRAPSSDVAIGVSVVMLTTSQYPLRRAPSSDTVPMRKQASAP